VIEREKRSAPPTPPPLAGGGWGEGAPPAILERARALRRDATPAERLLWQTQQRLAGNRSIPDRVVSLADPDARPIRKGKPRSPTQFGYTLLLAEDERGFVADHQLSKGNPADAPQLLPAVRRVAVLPWFCASFARPWTNSRTSAR